MESLPDQQRDRERWSCADPQKDQIQDADNSKIHLFDLNPILKNLEANAVQAHLKDLDKANQDLIDNIINPNSSKSLQYSMRKYYLPRTNRGMLYGQRTHVYTKDTYMTNASIRVYKDALNKPDQGGEDAGGSGDSRGKMAGISDFMFFCLNFLLLFSLLF